MVVVTLRVDVYLTVQGARGRQSGEEEACAPDPAQHLNPPAMVQMSVTESDHLKENLLAVCLPIYQYGAWTASIE